MAIRNRFIGRHLVWAFALAALIIGCGGRQEPRIDSSTNWLRECESSSECGELSCLCGVCNTTCSSDSACDGLDSNAECSVDGVRSASCGAVDESVCILRCSEDADCSKGMSCRDGLCGETMATAPSSDDAGPVVVADAGPVVIADAGQDLTDAGGGVDYGFDFTQIAVGGRHTCGLVSDGSMLCWGSDTYGALAGVDDAAADFTQLAAGGFHTCGLRRDGSLTCWGMGNLEVGQVSGPNADASTDFTHIAAGDQHTCALRSDGSVICWGADDYGQVSGPNADIGTDFTQLTGGSEHTCALRGAGTLTCWGRDLYGEVSGPNAETSSDFIQVAAGGHHTCALRTDGSLTCWGTEEFTDEVSGPNAFVGAAFKQVMTAFEQTCGLHENGSLRCWGADWDGQVSGPNLSRMARVVGFVQLSGSLEADGNHLCALAGDGTAQCWGNDDQGQLSGLDELARLPH